MRQSRPITESGHLIGVAAHDDREWFVIAIDPRIEDLHGARFRDARDAERMARRIYAREIGQSLGAETPR